MCVVGSPPDVINCANFHLYRADSFWVAGPRKFSGPATQKLQFTTAIQLHLALL